MRHIINGCSINLRQLTDRELDSLIVNNQKRADLLADESESLIGERIRRQPNHNVIALVS